jgi:hypothetical protein
MTGEKINALLQKPIIAVNIGLESFAQSLQEQDVEVAHLSWTPPAGGDQEMMDILDSLL